MIKKQDVCCDAGIGREHAAWHSDNSMKVKFLEAVEDKLEEEQ